MKKILFVVTVPGHINVFHLPYLKYFKENGYEVHVASSRNDNLKYCDKNIIIPIKRNPFKLSNIKAIFELKKIINKENYEIIHCHTPMGGVVARLAAKQARKKGTRIIYTAHGFHFYKGAPLINWLLYYPIEKYLSKYTDTLITINKEDYNLAKKKFNVKQLEYVPGVGINPEKFNISFSDKNKLALKSELNIEKNDFVMLSVGELNNNKNQIMQIEAMKILAKKHSNIKLLIAGNGNNYSFLEKKITEYNLSKNVKLLGFRTDIPQLLKITNLLLSTSKREGLPVNVMEALSNGIPVIGTNCRGTRDLIENFENGFLVKINDVTSMCNYIIEILNNKIDINKKTDEYLLPNIMKKMKKIYCGKKRVLHILNTNKFSGAEKVVCTIIKNMNDEYEMYYCSPNGPISKTLNNEKIDYLPIKHLSFFEIKKVIKKIKPDIIHAHDNRATVISSLFRKKAKIISHIHGNNKIMNNYNLKTLLFNFCSKTVNKIIWVSDSSLDEYYFKKNITKKSIVLYNVIDKKEIITKSNLYNCDQNHDLIFLGRLAYPKNPERLIEIIKTTKEKYSNVSVAIVGDGNDRELVENLIKKYNLKKNIKLYGFQDNPYPILKKSKILIMTSIYEGTPMCALEAQALGKPIIATPVDGLKKIVENNYNGYLSNKNEEIANYIVSVIKNDKLLKELSNNSIERFENLMNLSEYKKIIKNIYES